MVQFSINIKLFSVKYFMNLNNNGAFKFKQIGWKGKGLHKKILILIFLNGYMFAILSKNIEIKIYFLWLNFWFFSNYFLREN